MSITREDISMFPRASIMSIFCLSSCTLLISGSLPNSGEGVGDGQLASQLSRP